ncbi:hypothetical protein C8R44DRAFT_750573 [Mycena epipterygia]|nr:hypothetical protein C8R44DRAFT_750573 [Mycena epipterygia]
MTDSPQRNDIPPDTRSVEAYLFNQQGLESFTDHGFTLFNHAWPPQNTPAQFGAPRSAYNVPRMRDFVDYMVSGRETNENGGRVQYVLQHNEAAGLANTMAANGEFTVTRDYDSVLAVSNFCPVVNTDVEVCTIANFKKGLQGSTHMKLRFSIAEGRYEAQDPATHTTCLFGSFGPSSRNDIYLCFPSDRAAELESRIMQEAIYQAVRKAHEEVYPDNFHAYAATFDAEMARAPNNNSKVILAEYGVQDFMQKFQEELRGAGEWATTHYFIGQIRGVKDNYRHSTGCKELLDTLVANIDTQRDRTVVYVDVGLEVSPKVMDEDDEDISKQWSSLPINNIQGHLGIMDLPANVVNTRRVKTSFDPWCGTVGIQGFRLDATRCRGGVGLHQAIYGQVYVTDKFSTYHAGNNRSGGTAAIQIQPNDVLRMSDGRTGPKVSYRLSKIFLDNREIPVHTRYELRVPYQFAHLALWGREDDWDDIDVANINVQDVFAVYPTVSVWEYRWLNVAAATWITQELADLDPQEQRATPRDALVVAATTAYFMNTICARPADRSWCRIVASAAFPLDDAPHEDRFYLWDLTDSRTTKVPYFQHGRMYMPHIMWPGQRGTNLRFVYEAHRIFDNDQILRVFGSTRKQIEARYTLHKTISFRALGGATRRCKEPMGLLCQNPMIPAAALAIVFNPNFGFDDRGDIPAHEMYDDRWRGERHPTILFVEMLSQLIQRSGVSDHETFSRLSLTQQRLVGLSTFCDPHFCVYWDRVAWKTATNFKDSFDLLLPYADTTPVGYLTNQGWGQQSAWQTLMKIRERCPDQWNIWRRIMWQEVQTFKWFFALDRNKCFERKFSHSWTTHNYHEGQRPTQLIRILVKTDNPLLVRNTRPVLDPQMLEKYIADEIAKDAPNDGEGDPAAITAAVILEQHANRLELTPAQRQQLTRAPGTRVPAHIALREEEEEDSEEEGPH